MRIVAGIDGGSVSVKIVVLDENQKVLERIYRRHKGHPFTVTFECLKELIQKYPNLKVVFTGSAGKQMATSLGCVYVDELSAQALSTRRLYPEVKTIIEMGGEDSKLIILDGDNIKDFSLNSVCAAGTGSFLDQQAERLRLSIEEFSELALKSKKPPRIAGRCSVFAKSDMIHLQQIATPVEDIVAGLCFAVARNFKGSIVRGRPIFPEVSFQGGVALNKGMVRAFKEVFELENLVVPEEAPLMGAYGAAIKALEDAIGSEIDLSEMERLINGLRFKDNGHKPLISKDDDFIKRHLQHKEDSGSLPLNGKEKIDVYLGIDIGSISTNLAVIDDEGNLITKRYLMTAGRPIEAVLQGLREIGQEIADRVVVRGVGTTGSGRYMIADFVGADIVKNEITAQATAASFIDPHVDTIFEIGGQDSKYISLRDGVIVDFEMNKACAAGTGSFLEEQAEKLNISVKNEFAKTAFCSESPCRLGERCTVFMENSLMVNLQRGASKEDLLAGLAYSIVENYINRVVAGRPIGQRIFFQGGTAFNKAVVAAFEKYLGKPVIVPPNHDVTGAIGMALIARDYVKSKGIERSSFKGFDLVNRRYTLSSFECKGCENLCEINRVKIEGEKDFLFYGGRCEKYDIRRKKSQAIEDLFAYRDSLLWKAHEEWLKKKEEGYSPKRGIIGVPYVFYFHDYLPFWSTLLWELGFDVKVSPKTNRKIVNSGVECVLAETCFPIKVAHGHVRYLLEQGIRDIFLPSFVNMCMPEDSYEKGHACPLTQSFPYQIRVAFKGVNVIAPVVKLKEGRDFMIKELKRVFKEYSISTAEIKRALQKAEEAQERFFREIKSKGLQVLQNLKMPTIVIVGRPYNAFDMGVNLELPRKLATLNVQAIPMDFLPDSDIYRDWPDMYWRSGQRILKAARTLKEHPELFPIFIGNFSCGPDSFIQKYFEKELEGKPYLHIEIDEHSADAGAITRCEAFLDSIKVQMEKGKIRRKPQKPPRRTFISLKGNGRKRTIFIPSMSDHAYAVESAFKFCGVPAEVLPESDQKTIEIGRKYVSGKECYPCTVTTGDMLKKVFSPDFRPEESAFFMPSGTGPCRFGQYNLFQRMLLEQLGYDNVPIYSPVQDVTLYRDLGIVGNDFIKRAWQGVVAFDMLLKCLHETRPYEEIKGSTDELYNHYKERLRNALVSRNGSLEKVLQEMKQEFSSLKKTKERKPLIGIIGEIFVRSNRFSNEELVRKIEALGGEAWLSPVDEWIFYINYMSLKKALRKKDYSGIIQFLIKKFYQERITHKYEKLFEDSLKTVPEPFTKEVLKKASPYIHESFEGEAILSIGKAIDMIERGASGIINAMPFGCMPGTVVTAIMRAVSEQYGIPAISIPYDGTESATTELQLEAFMNQCRKKI